jgi:hypothetical protein
MMIAMGEIVALGSCLVPQLFDTLLENVAARYNRARVEERKFKRIRRAKPRYRRGQKVWLWREGAVLDTAVIAHREDATLWPGTWSYTMTCDNRMVPEHQIAGLWKPPAEWLADLASNVEAAGHVALAAELRKIAAATQPELRQAADMLGYPGDVRST